MGAGLLEDSDDPGRALVAGLLQIETAGQVRVGGDPADRHRPGVRGVAEQCAEDDDHLHAQLMGVAEDLVAERPPAHARLDTAHQHQVPGLLPGVRPDHREPGRRPSDLAHAALQGNGGPVHLEVVVVLGVERGEDLALPLPVQVPDRGRGGVSGVVPAFEGTDHDRVDQLGNPLKLDHPAPPSGRGGRIGAATGCSSHCVPPKPTAFRCSGRSPCPGPLRDSSDLSLGSSCVPLDVTLRAALYIGPSRKVRCSLSRIVSGSPH